MDCLSPSNFQLNKTSRNLREGTRSRQRPDQTKGFQRRCWERAFGRRRCWDLDPKFLEEKTTKMGGRLLLCMKMWFRRVTFCCSKSKQEEKWFLCIIIIYGGHTNWNSTKAYLLSMKFEAIGSLRSSSGEKGCFQGDANFVPVLLCKSNRLLKFFPRNSIYLHLRTFIIRWMREFSSKTNEILIPHNSSILNINTR